MKKNAKSWVMQLYYYTLTLISNRQAYGGDGSRLPVLMILVPMIASHVLPKKECLPTFALHAPMIEVTNSISPSIVENMADCSTLKVVVCSILVYLCNQEEDADLPASIDRNLHL